MPRGTAGSTNSSKATNAAFRRGLRWDAQYYYRPGRCSLAFPYSGFFFQGSHLVHGAIIYNTHTILFLPVGIYCLGEMFFIRLMYSGIVKYRTTVKYSIKQTQLQLPLLLRRLNATFEITWQWNIEADAIQYGLQYSQNIPMLLQWNDWS